MKKFIHRLLAACAVLAVGSSAVFAAAGGWSDNFDKALAEAKAQKKMVLLDFTGSDWCSWCLKLHKEVFAKPEFDKYAKNNLVLVTVDFPQFKTLPAQVATQNDKLQKKYGVEHFPTIIVLNSDGKKVGNLEYEEGGPGPFTAKLDALKGK
jgi:thioredoxin-related protein